MNDSPRRWKWLKIGALLLLALLSVPVGSYFYFRWQLGRELESALAEARAVDPALTIEELEADREVIPAAENSAPRIIAAAALLPETYTSSDHANLIQKTAPERPLDEKAAAALKTALQKAEPALDKLRGLEDLPRGRHAIEWKSDFVSTRMDHAQSVRQVANLLVLRATAQAEEGRPDEALASCRAALNAGRSLGDEFGLIPPLVRIACNGMTLAALERVLARTAPSEPALAAMQQALEEEDRAPLMLIAMRGERAGNQAVCQAVESGELSIGALTDGLSTGSLGPVEELMGRQLVAQARPYWLRYLTGLVRIAQQPPHQRKAALSRLSGDLGEPPVLARLLMGGLDKSVNAFLRNQAKLRVAIAALAVERYRIRHGRWPDAFDQLKPDFLKEVPLDPYDGQPMRYRRTMDGVLIYSIGPDETDDGGTIDRQANPHQTPGIDLGFQLWDLDQRGKKPE